MRLRFKETGGCPVVAHGQGNHRLKPIFSAIREAYERQPGGPDVLPRNMTLLTCNNGAEGMGMFERSVAARGLHCMVAGAGIVPWNNRRDKPQALVDALAEIATEYTLYADSRDCLLVGPPAEALEKFRKDFPGCEMLFGADIINWPPDNAFARFERGLPGAETGRMKFFNGGCWIGRTAYCREFFEEARRLPPAAAAPDSEQGVLKALFQQRHPAVRLDYRADVFLNCGYLGGNLVTIGA